MLLLYNVLSLLFRELIYGHIRTFKRFLCLQKDSFGDYNPLTIDIMSDSKPKQEKAIAEIKKLVEERGKIKMTSET